MKHLRIKFVCELNDLFHCHFERFRLEAITHFQIIEIVLFHFEDGAIDSIIMNRRERIDSSFPVADTSIEFFKNAIILPATNTIGEQVLEAVVTGPDGAKRLFTCTGIANVQMSLTRTQEETTETWTFLVGPTLPRPQFYRAIGTASVSLQTVDIQGAPAGFTVHVVSVEADWDDESERVEVRVEVLLNSNMIGVNINQLRYWVTILAQI